MGVRDGGRRLGFPEGRGEPFRILVNGTPFSAFPGETIGTALLGEGLTRLRETRAGGRARGLYCCMGVCYECLVMVEGEGVVRACLTPAREGMRISTDGRS